MIKRGNHLLQKEQQQQQHIFDTGTNISVFSAVTQAAQHFGAERLSTSVV